MASNAENWRRDAAKNLHDAVGALGMVNVATAMRAMIRLQRQTGGVIPVSLRAAWDAFRTAVEVYPDVGFGVGPDVQLAATELQSCIRAAYGPFEEARPLFGTEGTDGNAVEVRDASGWFDEENAASLAMAGLEEGEDSPGSTSGTGPCGPSAGDDGGSLPEETDPE